MVGIPTNGRYTDLNGSPGRRRRRKRMRRGGVEGAGHTMAAMSDIFSFTSTSAAATWDESS